jgi:hypothetical protein
VVRREHGDRPAPQQLGVHQPDRCVVTVEHVDEPEVEAALGQALVDLRLPHRQHLDRRGRPAGLEGLHRRHQQRRRACVHRAQPDETPVGALVASGGAEPVDGREHLLHVGQQLTTLPADPGPGAPSVEQDDLQFALELGHRLAQGRLGEVEPLAGSPQRPVPGHRCEVLELFDPHAVRLLLSGDRRSRSRVPRRLPSGPCAGPKP